MELATAPGGVTVDYRLLFEQCPAAILAVATNAPHWTTIAATDGFLATTARRREDLIGRGIFENFPQSNEDVAGNGVSNLASSLERVLRDGKADLMPLQKYDIKVDSRFQVRYWSISNTPVRDSNGNVRYILHRHDDVTLYVEELGKARMNELEQQAREMHLNILRQSAELQKVNVSLVETNQRLEVALAAAETASKVKAEFLANVSHEIRTPLNVVIGFAQILEHDPALSGTQREQVNVILKSGEHLLGLVNDILDQARMEAGKLVLHPVSVAPAEALRELALEMTPRCQSKGLSLHVDLAPDLPKYVLVDELRLRQMVLNLLDNAVKFTSKGEVRLKASCKAESDPRFVRLYITVCDTGPGIPEEDMRSLFQRFFQTGRHAGHSGTGLGLPITRQLARKMGGDAYATSTVGEGSQFTLEIVAPRNETTQQQQRFAQSSSAARLESRAVRVAKEEAARQVMVVDDDEVSRRMLRTMLEQMGFQHIVELGDGAAAVAAAARAWPAIVFMDRVMPIMSGVEAARRLRAMSGGDQLPIVAVTASVGTPMDERSSTLFNAALPKPLSFAELQQALAVHGGFHFAPTSDEVATSQRVSRRVLVVDDHVLNQRVVTAALERAGHRVEVCSSGEEAVRKAATEAFDVVLMDLRMPGIDGFEATRRLREVTHEVHRQRPHVVLMSASALDEDAHRCKEVGVDAVLPKPFRLADLLTVVSAAGSQQRTLPS